MASRKRNFVVYLPEQVRVIILEKLILLSDLYRCRCVSSEWKSAATQVIKSLSNPLLCRVITQRPTRSICHFESSPNIRIHDITIPTTYFDEVNRYSLAYHRGWLLVYGTTRTNKNIFMYNPKSTEKIILPQLPKERKVYPRVQFVISPLIDEICIVLLWYNGDLIFCSPGDKNWTPVLGNYDRSTYIRDMIYFRGSFYAVGYDQLLTMNLGSKCQFVSWISRIGDGYDARYLVESPSKNLLMVDVKMQEDCWIKSYKMDERTCRWVRMEEAGYGNNVTYFLSSCGSMYTSVEEKNGYRSNCIYFFNDNFKPVDSGMRCCGIGLYDTEKKKMEFLHRTLPQPQEPLFAWVQF